VTDDAKNYQAVRKGTEKIHKHNFLSPCVCYTLNLIFKDFADALAWLRDTYKDEKNLVNAVLITLIFWPHLETIRS